MKSVSPRVCNCGPTPDIVLLGSAIVDGTAGGVLDVNVVFWRRTELKIGSSGSRNAALPKPSDPPVPGLGRVRTGKGLGLSGPWTHTCPHHLQR